MQLSNKTYKFQSNETDDITFKLLSAAASDQAFATIKQLQEDYVYTEYIFNTITESKYNIDELPSGLPLLIVYSCLKLSGYFKDTIDLPNTIENFREKAKGSLFLNVFRGICEVFPQYKLSELKTLSTNELFELLVFAESVAGKQIFDTDKMKKSILSEDTNAPVAKKGIASVTADELDLLKQIIAREEEQYQGLPHY